MHPRPHRKFRIPAELNGSRLDRALAELARRTRSWAQERIRSGVVELGGEAVRKPSHAVVAHDVIVVHELAEPDPEPSTTADLAAEAAALGGPDISILHDDAEFAVIEKPAGMLTHGAGPRGAGSVAARVDARFGPLPTIQGDDRPGIVHRLDAGTSGLLVIGKTERALEHLIGQFRARTVAKTYLALCLGQPRFDSHWIDTPIARNERHPERMTVAEEGRPSETYYEVRERFERASFIECRPKTGRTHQVRVHMASIGHPLVGDRFYRQGVPRLASGAHRAGLRNLPDEAPELERHALHAAAIELEHPTSGERISFRSELAADMAALLAWLRTDAAQS